MRGAIFALALVMLRVAPAQTPLETANLLSLTDHLQSAIDAEDWPRAAELSRALRQAVAETRNSALASKSEEQINAALGWLPSDTETVVVAKEAFMLDFNSQRGSVPPGALRLTQSYTLTPVSSKATEELTAKLEGQTLRFALFAARRFQNREPTGNAAPHGLIAYQGCGIYGLAKPLASQPFARPPDETPMGYITWSAKPESDSRADTVFISQPKPDLLVACNNRNFLFELLSRIDGPQSSRAFAQDGTELRLVDRSAPLWAIRRFLPGRAGLDPSYPSAGGLMGIGDMDATALVFEAGAPKMAIRAQWISKSRMNPWQALTAIPEVRGTAKVQVNREGLWQLAVEQDGSASLYAALALMGLLGFVTVL
jgi:hypothetical protein